MLNADKILKHVQTPLNTYILTDFTFITPVEKMSLEIEVHSRNCLSHTSYRQKNTLNTVK